MISFKVFELMNVEAKVARAAVLWVGVPTGLVDLLTERVGSVVTVNIISTSAGNTLSNAYVYRRRITKNSKLQGVPKKLHLYQLRQYNVI